jgi:hypothetical protein
VSKSSHNEGLIQSGGTINVGGSLAVGSHAVAHSETSAVKASLDERGLKKISEHLDALVQAISQHVPDSSNREQLHSYTREMKQELQQTTPDKSKLSATLEKLASGAKSFTSILGLVEGLKSLITSIF